MRRKYVLLLIFITCVTLIWFLQDKHNVIKPVIKDGYVQITPFEQQSTIYQLSGEWEFYPNQWLNSSDFPIDEPTYIETPYSWEDHSIIKQHGIGTYRLQYDISEEEIGKTHSFYFQYIGSAYKAYLNGELVAEVGELGLSAKEEVPFLRDEIIFYEADQVNNELVIQVSNYSFREGGIIEDVYYGDHLNVISFMFKDIIEQLLLIGGFLFISIYFYFKFMINRNDKTFLYICLISFMAMIRTFLLTENMFQVLFPSVTWTLMIKIEYTSLLFGMILLIQFMYDLYRQEINQKIYYFTFIVLTGFLVFILLTPTYISTNFLLLHVTIILFTLLYFVLFTGIKAIINNREGSIINIIGILLMIIAAIVETIFQKEFVNFPMTLTYSILLFLILQGVIISKRYDRLSERNLELANSLSELNNTLEQKVNKRTIELERKNKELIQLHQSRSDMMENIAHDLGSPMNAFEKQLILIKQGYIKPSEPLLDTLIQKTRSIKRLANDLFELSQLQLKKWSIHRETVQINKFINDLENLFGYELSQLGLNLQTTCNIPENYLIQVDKERIIQVIRNFVDNAIKHGEEKDTIRIDASIYKEKYLFIEVEDFGKGIEQAELPYIFDRLYRTQKSSNTGSGLGLTIAKEIIEQHDGEIGVVSEIGIGTKFYFMLPIE
ncbi:ATP-binding protein [Gracilibacillus xinjiangensis]|uniref:histidine kinase n=1 Tax=Gracilibacillus xinjiangensis TaxID=1193282 RepID=A0ABV8WQJ8_9BACI